ncbi:MAG: patatin-like phospholipase family protein [Acholeplasmataceae bacterium]
MKVGLMLGGGGARGAYQIGVLKALEEHGLSHIFDVISGASIGALNGYFYLASNSYQKVLDSWIYGVVNNPIDLSKRLKGKDKRGLFSTSVIKEMEDKFMDQTIFKQTKTKLYVISTKINTPKLTSMVPWKWSKVIRYVNESANPLKEAISSSSIPIIFGATEVEDSYFIDGGLVDNNPIDVLIDKGCRLIFACSLDPSYDYRMYKEHNITIVNVTSTNSFPRGIIKHYLGVIDFNESLIHQRVEYGYYVMSEMIKECVRLGIINIENKKYKLGKLDNKFKLINVPLYVRANVKLMRTSYEQELLKEKKA